jgi:hypothetical protein
MDQNLVAVGGIEFTIAKWNGADVANFVTRIGRAEL